MTFIESLKQTCGMCMQCKFLIAQAERLHSIDRLQHVRLTQPLALQMRTPVVPRLKDGHARSTSTEHPVQSDVHTQCIKSKSNICVFRHPDPVVDAATLHQASTKNTLSKRD